MKKSVIFQLLLLLSYLSLAAKPQKIHGKHLDQNTQQLVQNLKDKLQNTRASKKKPKRSKRGFYKGSKKIENMGMFDIYPFNFEDQFQKDKIQAIETLIKITVHSELDIKEDQNTKEELQKEKNLEVKNFDVIMKKIEQHLEKAKKSKTEDEIQKQKDIKYFIEVMNEAYALSKEIQIIRNQHQQYNEQMDEIEHNEQVIKTKSKMTDCQAIDENGNCGCTHEEKLKDLKEDFYTLIGYSSESQAARLNHQAKFALLIQDAMIAADELKVCKVSYRQEPQCPQDFDHVGDNCIKKCDVRDQETKSYLFLYGKTEIEKKIKKYFIRNLNDNRCYETCLDDKKRPIEPCFIEKKKINYRIEESIFEKALGYLKINVKQMEKFQHDQASYKDQVSDYEIQQAYRSIDINKDCPPNSSPYKRLILKEYCRYNLSLKCNNFGFVKCGLFACALNKEICNAHTKKEVMTSVYAVTKLILLIVVTPAYLKFYKSIDEIYNWISETYFRYLDHTINQWTQLSEINELAKTKIVYLMAQYIEQNQQNYDLDMTSDEIIYQVTIYVDRFRELIGGVKENNNGKIVFQNFVKYFTSDSKGTFRSAFQEKAKEKTKEEPENIQKNIQNNINKLNRGSTFSQAYQFESPQQGQFCSNMFNQVLQKSSLPGNENDNLMDQSIDSFEVSQNDIALDFDLDSPTSPQKKISLNKGDSVEGASMTDSKINTYCQQTYDKDQTRFAEQILKNFATDQIQNYNKIEVSKQIKQLLSLTGLSNLGMLVPGGREKEKTNEESVADFIREQAIQHDPSGILLFLDQFNYPPCKMTSDLFDDHRHQFVIDYLAFKVYPGVTGKFEVEFQLIDQFDKGYTIRSLGYYLGEVGLHNTMMVIDSNNKDPVIAQHLKPNLRFSLFMYSKLRVIVKKVADKNSKNPYQEKDEGYVEFVFVGSSFIRLSVDKDPNFHKFVDKIAISIFKYDEKLQKQTDKQSIQTVL